MKLYTADTINNKSNCLYPHEHFIKCEEDLEIALCHDYVCAQYRSDYRSDKNFISSDCLAFDCDNTHSEDPKKWVTPDDVVKTFDNVLFYVHYSRSNNIPKGTAAARPRFHVLFPIGETKSLKEYVALKQSVSEYFPYFDRAAMDGSRFFFGTTSPNVQYYDGEVGVDAYMFAEETNPFEGLDEYKNRKQTIKEGKRNNAMSKFAFQVLVRFGITQEARDAFDEKSETCEPPLDETELNAIWASACKGYKSKVLTNPDYVSPEEWNSTTYMPDDFSDVGQAAMLSKNFADTLRYSAATSYIKYEEGYWQESETKAQGVVHELTRRQMNEAERMVAEAVRQAERMGILQLIGPMGKQGRNLTEPQQEVADELKNARTYLNFVKNERASKAIAAALKEARPMIEITPEELDADDMLLNTPTGTYDLRKGNDGLKPHRAEDYCTKITTVSPGNKGADLWYETLNTFFCGDAELIRYVQDVCGIAAIGKVYVESMIIAYGSGSNGKSTFWNTIARVLGSYSGTLSAETLTSGYRRNTSPEIAETKGKRLLIAAELQEGARLNDAMVKKLCSTDRIQAEKKFKDPFSFVPSHTLVLYTNHLPKVGATDEGIWRRLIVVPFLAEIRGKKDVKNFADRLYTEAGPAVLAWIIDGAKRVIDNGFKLKMPAVVEEAIREYRERSDWLQHFLDDRCVVDPGERESGLALYQAYKTYSDEMGEYARRKDDFVEAMERAGFRKSKVNRKSMFYGLKLED